MNLLWTSKAWDDYLFWQGHEPTIADKINTLLKDVRRTPFSGVGKPEPLKGRLAG